MAMKTVAWFSRFYRDSSLPPGVHTAIAPAPAASVEAGEIMETLIAELALLDEAERLLEPEDALNLEESDVRQLLF